MLQRIIPYVFLLGAGLGMGTGILDNNNKAIMANCLVVIASIAWLILMRNVRVLTLALDKAAKQANSDRITIDQLNNQLRRKDADLSTAYAHATNQMGVINNLESRLRTATSIPAARGIVSTREAILEPTPPARANQLPGFNQNRVAKEERRVDPNPHAAMGGHYRESISDDGDNGLGSFALGAMVGALGNMAIDRAEQEGMIEPGGGSFGGAGASASWAAPEPVRCEPAYVESSRSSDNDSSSRDSGNSDSSYDGGSPASE